VERAGVNWAATLTSHLQVGDRVRVYADGDPHMPYTGTPHIGTVVGFRYSANDTAAPVVLTDDERLGNTPVTHYWDSFGGRTPDPYRDAMARVGEHWVKQYDQTPNPAHAAIVEIAAKRAHRQRSRMGHYNSLPWWLNDCCEPDPDAFTSNAHLFDSWNVWAEAHSGRLLPEEWLPQELENRGFRPGSSEGADGIFGLRFQDDVAEWVPEEAAKQAAKQVEREGLARAARASGPAQAKAAGGILPLVGMAGAAIVLFAVANWAWRTVFG
jgi:hypothetical protein